MIKITKQKTTIIYTIQKKTTTIIKQLIIIITIIINIIAMGTITKAIRDTMDIIIITITTITMIIIIIIINIDHINEEGITTPQLKYQMVILNPNKKCRRKLK